MKDREGNFLFKDRLGDTFRWKGENVSTGEVASILSDHPAVHEVNVFGVSLPHHDGRAGCAAIVLKESADMNDLASFARQRLPKYAVPLFLRFMQSLPLTGTHKQQKYQLVTEGVEPDNVTDKFYWLQGDQYVDFESAHWQKLRHGVIKL